MNFIPVHRIDDADDEIYINIDLISSYTKHGNGTIFVQSEDCFWVVSESIQEIDNLIERLKIRNASIVHKVSKGEIQFA